MKYAVVVATLTTAGRYALLLFPVLYYFVFIQAAFYTLVFSHPWYCISGSAAVRWNGVLVECSVCGGAPVF